MAKGDNPNSRANLLQGSNMGLLKSTDPETRRLTNELLNEEVNYDGRLMTYREAIIRVHLDKAVFEKDLRSAQFIFNLSDDSEKNSQAIKTATLDPLEALKAKMLPRTVDDRREKAD